MSGFLRRMATIQIHGQLPHIIVKKLDALTLKVVIPRSCDRDRNITYTGKVEGTREGKDFAQDEMTIERGVAHKVTCKNITIDMDFPLYVSTIGLLKSRSKSLYSCYTIGGAFVSWDGEVYFIDDMLLFHDKELNPLQSIKGTGNFIYGRLDSPTKDFNQGRFNGTFKSEAGIAGDIMELEGEFMLKPKGYAKRDEHVPYPLKGDWEASLCGKVQAMVDKPAYTHTKMRIDMDFDYIKKEFVIPSLIEVRAMGELLK